MNKFSEEFKEVIKVLNNITISQKDHDVISDFIYKQDKSLKLNKYLSELRQEKIDLIYFGMHIHEDDILSQEQYGDEMFDIDTRIERVLEEIKELENENE